MADTNETIADIIAEMRKISAEKYRLSSENGGAYGNPGVYHLDFAQFARVISDRFEAAHRRERGDCAKLREALEHMVRAETYGSMERDDLCGRCLEKMFARCKHDGTCWVDKAITALSAPPRNCDRPECATTKAAADVWRKEDGGKTAYHDWLLALSTEKEGGAK